MTPQLKRGRVKLREGRKGGMEGGGGREGSVGMEEGVIKDLGEKGGRGKR